jgi:hypothetical protein
MIQIDLFIGSIGMLLILAAFILEEFAKHTRNESILYNLLNLLGALLLCYYAATLNSWPFLILNSIWIIVALLKLFQLFYPRARSSQ